MAAVAGGIVSEMDMEEDSYVLEQVTIPDYSDDDFTYEEVSVEDNYSLSEGSEDLETAVRTLKEETVDKNILQKQNVPVLHNASVTLRSEVMDDFVRNFLVKMGMTRTLDCFQNEWYELQERGLLDNEEVKVVPDIYVSNQNLDDMVKSLREEVTRFKDAADRARQTYVRLRKERDFHRMHHKRVVQEKNKLITDLRRLKKHYASYEPTLKTLKQKYEVAMKEKMLTKLERDRAVGQIIGLQSTLQNMGENINFEEPQGNKGPEIPKEFGEKVIEKDLVSTTKAKQHPKDTSFPPDMGINPLLTHQKGPSPHLSRAGGFRLTNTINAHNLAVSGISLHPRKQVLASCSDDHTWKMWSVPSGDLIMTGEGHKDWIADCDFHPGGGRLATASGDSTVKIWDFTKAECVLTFTDHIHAVWGCSWHSCGDFLATCSMDCSGKIWDLNSERCRLTLRGHADSVNSISFLPYSNTLLSCSADKTLSLWDARTGLCGQTFFGHLHSINHCVFNLRGDTIASCDSYGEIKLWDVRTVGSLASIYLGPHPANRVAFDSSGCVLAIASNDGSVRMYEVASSKQSQLTGHEEAVQTVLFDKGGEFLMSAGSDGTVRIWS